MQSTAVAATRSSVMMHLLAGTAMLALAPLTAGAQELDLSGYLENTSQLDYTGSVGAEFLNASKLRVDLQAFAGSGFSLVGNVNAIWSLGAVERHLSPYLPPSVRAAMEAAGVPDTFSIDRTRVFVDNVYLAWAQGPVRVRIGKQQLSWGPGYSFNPTDLFHRKNLVDPTYEKEGVTAVRADYQWGVGGQLSLIVKPRESLTEHLAFVGTSPTPASVAGVALRAGTHVGAIGADIALTLHQVTDSTALAPLTLDPIGQRRRAFGLEMSGTLLGLGVWLEGNMNFMEQENDFARVLAGADYTLADGTYLTAEVLYNGRPHPHRPYPLHDWFANLQFGEPVGPGWILVGVQRDVSALVRGGGYVFATPGGSVLLNPRLDISLLQDLDAVVFGGITLGSEEGPFPPGLASLVVRGTYYFRL